MAENSFRRTIRLMNPKIDNYLAEGCMRCPLGGTPDCKVHNWQAELKALRMIVLDCGLAEELKWSMPCYTYGSSNVAMVAAFKDYCSLSFFKGALLSNDAGMLVKPGENTQGDRLIKFASLREIVEAEPLIKACVYEAIEVEKAGLKVAYKKGQEPLPEELQRKLEEDPALRAAFEALTPGKQRGYLLHFSSAKQAQTREARIVKCIPKILAGKGWGEY